MEGVLTSLRRWRCRRPMSRSPPIYRAGERDAALFAEDRPRGCADLRRVAPYTQITRRAVRSVPSVIRAAEDGGRQRIRGARHPVHLCDRQAVLWSRSPMTNGEAALKAGNFQKLDRQSGRRALRDRRRRDDESAWGLRRAEAENRPGQQHRAGPVRRRERGTGLSLVAAYGQRKARDGRSR